MPSTHTETFIVFIRAFLTLKVVLGVKCPGLAGQNVAINTRATAFRAYTGCLCLQLLRFILDLPTCFDLNNSDQLLLQNLPINSVHNTCFFFPLWWI